MRFDVFHTASCGSGPCAVASVRCRFGGEKGCATAVRRSAHHPIEPPAVGDALELVLAGLFEDETRAGNQIFHRLGDDDL